VNTLLYAQLLYEIISLQNIIMSKKRKFTFFIDARVPSANSDSVQPDTRREYINRIIFCICFLSLALEIL